MAGSFKFKHFEVKNERSAMKVGTDGVFLGAWVSINGSESTILDVGTGTGVIALMLAQRTAATQIVAIDIDRESVEEAAYNFRESQWSDRLSVELCDFRKWNGQVDLIVCNPPFFSNFLKAPEGRRSAARHNDTLTHMDLIDGALRTLSLQGRMAVVLPCEEGQKLILHATGEGLYVFRKCFLKTAENKPPKRVFIEFSKSKTPPAESEEILLDSKEYKTLTQDYYL